MEHAAFWRGINHLALVTDDMDVTVRFYDGILGAQLVATVASDDFRHYFFEFGPGCTVAFFEYAGFAADRFVKEAGVPDRRAPQFDHVAFNVLDEEALCRLRARLVCAGVDVSEIVDHRTIRSVYFTDPNGIALEASWWKCDPTGRPADRTDRTLFADPNPVAAVLELQSR